AQIALRHVISISHALLGCMGRDHGVAGSIEQDPLQGSVVLGPRCDVMGSLLSQSPLHGLKQLAVDQWRLRARADLTFIENLADVEAIACTCPVDLPNFSPRLASACIGGVSFFFGSGASQNILLVLTFVCVARWL